MAPYFKEVAGKMVSRKAAAYMALPFILPLGCSTLVTQNTKERKGMHLKNWIVPSKRIALVPFTEGLKRSLKSKSMKRSKYLKLQKCCFICSLDSVNYSKLVPKICKIIVLN